MESFSLKIPPFFFLLLVSFTVTVTAHVTRCMHQSMTRCYLGDIPCPTCYYGSGDKDCPFGIEPALVNRVYACPAQGPRMTSPFLNQYQTASRSLRSETPDDQQVQLEEEDAA